MKLRDTSTRKPVCALVCGIVAAVLASAMPAARAQNAPQDSSLQSTPQDAILASNREVLASVGGQRLQYTETIDGYFGDSEIGKQAAASVGATWMGTLIGIPRFLMQGRYEFARGKSAYTGFLQNLQTGVVTPYASSTDIETADWQLRIGKGFEDDSSAGMLTPYVSAGTHRWVRDATKTDPYGYLEVYKHKFVEAGVDAQVRMAPQLVGTLGLDLGTTFGADIGAPALGVSTTLKHERMLGCTFAFDYSPVPHMHLKAEYRDLSFRYGRSVVTSNFNLFEPDSYSYQSTAFLSIGFGF